MQARQVGTGQPQCPHCGGTHWGQRYDDCTYVNILKDPEADEEQRKNAAEWLRLHQEDSEKTKLVIPSSDDSPAIYKQRHKLVAGKRYIK